MQLRRAGLVPVGTRAVGPVEERFWRFVAKSEGCWSWVGGSKAQKGYGLLQTGGRGSARVLAHRLSYEIHHGPIPDGLVVMHKCDNPNCVNPDHLRVGTTSENVKEAYEKRRKVSPFKRGADHHGALLNEEAVRIIRAHPTTPLKPLAAMFGCSTNAVSAVRNGRTWKHVS